MGTVLVSDKYGPMAAKIGDETWALHGGTADWERDEETREVMILDSRGPLGEQVFRIGDEVEYTPPPLEKLVSEIPCHFKNSHCVIHERMWPCVDSARKQEAKDIRENIIDGAESVGWGRDADLS